MIRACLGLAVLLWSSAAAAEFRPVEDRAYRYHTAETRTADGVIRRFHASRSVVFHRTDAGYDVTVTLDAVDEQAGGDVGRMFLAATGALLHRPLRYRLDANGAIVGVEDADAAIARIADAIEAISAHPERSGDARVLASPLRTLPPERKAAMLRSIVAPLIAGAAAERAPGQRAITVPSRPPLPSGTALIGTETLSRNVNGIITIDIHASGGVDTSPPPETHGRELAVPTAAPGATIHTIRNIDSASGLLIDSRDVAETHVRDSDTDHATRIETTVTLALVTAK